MFSKLPKTVKAAFYMEVMKREYSVENVFKSGLYSDPFEDYCVMSRVGQRYDDKHVIARFFFKEDAEQFVKMKNRQI